MPVVTLPDGSTVTVGLDAIFAEDGQTPFTAPVPQGFVPVEQVEAARKEEKDKLYSRIEENNRKITELTGTLTAAQQAEKDRLEREQAALAAEQQRQADAELDAKSLLEKRQSEWQQQLQSVEKTWEQKFAEIDQARQAAEAAAAKEREFGALRDHILQVTEANKENIAPQLLPWITGNTVEEVDAAVARAIETTNSITAEVQQVIGQQAPQQQAPYGQPQYAQVPAQTPVPVPVGTHVTAPVGADPTQQYQNLTAEQIQNMPMDQFAKLRGQMGIGGQSNNRGLFG